jgi:hypothetical protein
MIDTVVVGWGCPRAGTTFLQRALQRLGGCFSFKLAEYVKMHPGNSTSGLIDIVALLGDCKKVVLVRIVRHPMETVESYLAARLPKADRKRSMGIARNADRQIQGNIKRESESFAQQRVLLRENPKVKLVVVKYEDLMTAKGQAQFVKDLQPYSNPKAFADFLATFGKKPVRWGRLEMGMAGQKVSTPEERDYFLRGLRPTIKREGYAI